MKQLIIIPLYIISTVFFALARLFEAMGEKLE